MKQLKQLVYWFINEERGNVLLFATATAILATMGLFFFTAIREMSMKQKERITHMYNATVMAMSINNYISTYLSMLAYPKSNLLNMNDGTPQFSASELTAIISYSNYQIVSLEDLESNGLIVSGNDPSQKRINGNNLTYDKKATKIKLTFKLDENEQVEDIYYLVNLAGSAYEYNAPYSNAEPFFYLVSFNDDYGTGAYGTYDLTDNEITLHSNDSEILESVLEVSGRSPNHERVILLPEDQ